MKAKPKKTTLKNVAPTMSLEQQAFQKEAGYFGSKLGNPSSVSVSPDKGEYVIEGDVGATRRPGSSAPQPRAAKVSSESDWQAGEVPRNYRKDGQ
jgi:hypothetical protein